VSLFFFVVSFLVELVDDFFVDVEASFFWVEDFLVVVDVLAGAVVVAVSVLLVEQAPSRPAANRTVNE
jgi:hypothetical protein